MQKNKYPKFIDKKCTESIKDLDQNRIYKIRIPLCKNGDKEMMILSKAPKPQDIDGCSNLVCRALKYIYNKKLYFDDVKFVNFTFIFPVIEYDKDTLKNTLEQEGELFLIGNDEFYIEDELVKNDEVIFKTMKECDYIIFAWGEPQENIKLLYDDRINHILKSFKIIKNGSIAPKKAYNIGNLTQNGYPRSSIVWGEELELVDYEI